MKWDDLDELINNVSSKYKLSMTKDELINPNNEINTSTINLSQDI